ncbi:unnamed protein product [Parajaminaea phylloscopi]
MDSHPHAGPSSTSPGRHSHSRSTVSRSISYGQPSSPPAASSSSRALPAPIYIPAHEDDADSAHASSSYRSGLATRTRSRSVGAKSKSTDDATAAFSQHPLAQIGHSLDRGPGTPDFVLGDGASGKARPKGKGRLQDILRDGGEGDGPSASVPAAVSTAGNTGNGRPKLGSRLRSFFTALSSGEGDKSSLDARAKARTSNELHRRGEQQGHLLKPQGLVIPAARQAGVQPFGVHGLNDESPPLTPTSEDTYDYARPATNQHTAWEHNPSASSSDNLRDSSSDPPAILHVPRRTSHSMSLGTGGALAGLLPSHHSSDEDEAVRSIRRRSAADGSLLLSALGDKLRAGLHSRSLRQHMPTLLMLLTFFVFSTLVVLLLLSTLPLRMPAHSLTQLSLSEMRDICLSLRDYAASTPAAYHHTLLVLCTFFTYKQAFNVPGSIVSNIVFGALFGTWRAAFWLSVFTAVGGSGAAIMSALVAPLVLKMPGMTKAVDVMKRAIGSQYATGSKAGSAMVMGRRVSRAGGTRASRRRNPSDRARSTSPCPPRHRSARDNSPSSSGGGNLYSILLLLRVLPLTPYGMMNIACGILNVPLLPFGTTLALGSLPWNAVTAQLGEILVEVVAALPSDDALDVTSPTLGQQLDGGGYHASALDSVSAGSAVKAALTGEKSKISSAAHKAGGGLKILMAKIWTREMMLKLVGLSLLSLAPIILGKWWKARQAAAAATKTRRKVGEQRKLAPAHQMGPLSTTAQADLAANHPSAPSAPEHVSVDNASNGLPAWINQSSDDDDEGFHDDDDESYFGDDYSDAGSEEEEEAISPASSTSPLSAFAASVAEKSNTVGPALIASLTRSASRNSWRSAVSRPWFGSADSAASVSPEKKANGPKQGGWSNCGNVALTTPQLELAENPFDMASHSAPAHKRNASGSSSKWGWTQDAYEGQTTMTPPQQQQRSHPGAAPSFSLTHPALDGLDHASRGWSSPASSPAHSRQASLAGGHYQHLQGSPVNAAKLQPKKLRGVIA